MEGWNLTWCTCTPHWIWQWTRYAFWSFIYYYCALTISPLQDDILKQLQLAMHSSFYWWTFLQDVHSSSTEGCFRIMDYIGYLQCQTVFSFSSALTCLLFILSYIIFHYEFTFLDNILVPWEYANWDLKSFPLLGYFFLIEINWLFHLQLDSLGNTWWYMAQVAHYSFK